MSDPTEQSTTPTPSPGPPDEFVAALSRDHSFTLQTVMELQKSIGGLTEATNNLKNSVDTQGSSIKWITRVLWTATGSLVILVPIIVYLVDKKFDTILQALGSK